MNQKVEKQNIEEYGKNIEEIWKTDGEAPNMSDWNTDIENKRLAK